MIVDLLISLIVIGIGVFALVLFCVLAVASILVSFISENILPLSAFLVAYILVRYFGL